MCFVKTKSSWGLVWPHWENIETLTWKDGPIGILRRTPKTREQITSIIEAKIAELPKKDKIDKWDKL